MSSSSSFGNEVFNLDTNVIICMFLSKNGEHRTKCRKLQCRHFLTTLSKPSQSRLSKSPVLRTNGLFFNIYMWSEVPTSKFC